MSPISNIITQAKPFFLSQKGSLFVVLILLVVFLLNSTFSIVGKSLTYDEPYHYQYGVNILDGDSTRFDDSKMPFSAWNALPAKIASFLPDGHLKTTLEKMVVARFMTIIFSTLIAFMVFYWARELYGVVPGWISLVLYIFDPNIIAHSQVVTTDVYVMGMMLVSSYFLWKFSKTRYWRDGLLFALMLGLAQLAKYTAVSLYPLFALIFFVRDVPSLKQSFLVSRKPQFLKKEFFRYVKYFLIVAITTIIIINIGFLFNRTFANIQDYELKASIFQRIQSQISFVVPTPYPYLEGLDWITAKENTDLGFIHIYLLGETRFGEGFPGYYLIASALKMPIATQVLLALAFLVYCTDKNRRDSFWKNEWFLLGLVVFYVVYFNFFYKSQMGIRYYLVIFPLLYVFAGNLFLKWRNFSRLQVFCTITLLILLVSSVLAKYPNYLSYFNEFIDQKEAYKYLADSNLEWGQDTHLLHDYRINHPDVLRAPEIPEPITETSIYFVSINRLVGVVQGPERYRWLRENFEPIDIIGNSFLIYRIAPEEIEELCLKTSFCTPNEKETD